MIYLQYSILLFILINFVAADESIDLYEDFKDADLENLHNKRGIDLKKLLVDEDYSHDKFFHKLPKADHSQLLKTWSYDNTTAMLNCLGINNRISNTLELYFKRDANGTRALKVFFHFYQRNATERSVVGLREEFSIDEIGFNISKRTIFIIPGFLVDGDVPWVLNMTDALLKWDDVNVFVVDWGDGANTWNYMKAAVNTVTVGDQMATFINQLSDQATKSKIPRNKWGPLHLIGHSLGAHIGGYAAKEINKREGKWLINRITGLDPAQPCYRFSDPALRLNSLDAEFVDIIHTNGRLLEKLGLGLPYQMGHVDFYPNGGIVQPVCILSASPIWKYLRIPVESIKSAICSHGISHDYLIDSIIMATNKNCTFWARDWDLSVTEVESILTQSCKHNLNRKCIEMGINAEKYNGNGTYFVVTGDSSPYCDVDSSVIEKITQTLHLNQIGINSKN